jgi:hypothetical protein
MTESDASDKRVQQSNQSGAVTVAGKAEEQKTYVVLFGGTAKPEYIQGTSFEVRAIVGYPADKELIIFDGEEPDWEQVAYFPPRAWCGIKIDRPRPERIQGIDVEAARGHK